MPGKTTRQIVGTGLAIVAGLLLVLLLGWYFSPGDDAPEAAMDGTAVTETAESLRWPNPPERPQDRSDRPLLELVGIVARNEDPIAIIREKDGAAQSYRIGDRVVDERELIEIHETHVLLRNRGRTERLRITGRNSRQPPNPEDLREFAESLKPPPEDAGDASPD